MSFVSILIKKGYNIFIITFLLLLGSCSTKTIRVLSYAEVKEVSNRQTINYKSPIGFIILPIRIDNNTYHFLFDTGAQTTLISEELALKTGVKSIGNINIEDSQNKHKKLKVGVVENFYIGDISYSNIGVIINDFNENKSFSCMGIDGILGMNVIKLNNWNIDYDNQIITLYDSKYEYSSQDLTSVSFYTNSGIPYIDLYVDGEREKFMIDTGKNGDMISISSKPTMNNVKQLFLGYSSLGLFGKSDIDTIKLTSVALSDSSTFIKNDIVVSQSPKNKNLIGTGFLQETYHSVFFDFKKNKMYLKERENINKIKNYPFFTSLTSDGTIVISAVEINFKEFNIGDTIVSFNEKVFSSSSSCSFVSEIWQSIRKREISTISVSRGNYEIKTASFIK